MKNKVIAIDSNIFIYYFEDNPFYIFATRSILKTLIDRRSKGITSIISLIEVLSYPSPPDLLEMIEEKFKTLPNLTIYDVDEALGIEVARIRRSYGFRLPDAIHLATAKLNKADVFITNDARLKKFKDIEVVLLKDIDN